MNLKSNTAQFDDTRYPCFIETDPAIKTLLMIILVLSLFLHTSVNAEEQVESIKVGWIGAMVGPTAKWGAYQAAMLAVEDVNSQGGINGRRLELIYEASYCDGKSAVTAFKKLVDIDNVSFILGGHCSPDSLAFAPLAEQEKVLSIAAISSSPKLSNAGDYIFRMTPISTRLAEIIVPYAIKTLHIQKLAILHELTDYVVPVAEKFNQLFTANGGTVTSVSAFNPGEADFRSILTKISNQNVDSIYLGVQAPDTALLLMKQIQDLKLKPKIIGNEQFAGAFLSASDRDRSLLDGVIFAEPRCNLDSSSTKSFANKYSLRYHVRDLPFGCYTGEAYDSVQILALALKKCGEVVDCVKDELYRTKNYDGASGSITFNSKGDVDKQYVIKTILDGNISEIY